MKRILTIGAVILILSAPVLAQDFCEGLADYDQDVDGTDAAMFKSHFGRSAFQEPCPPDGPAPVPKTGQITSYATGDDGNLERGVDKPPSEDRFTDNGDGTVTDNLTGLIWLKNANCFGMRMWNNALSDCNGLEDGECGLTDDSSPGDWRLPNIFELESLRDMKYTYPCLSDTTGTGQWSEGNPFNSVQYINFDNYWSSTTSAHYSGNAWCVNMNYGYVYNLDKSEYDGYNHYYAWCVRGGH